MTSNVTTNNAFSLQLFTEFTPRGSFYPRIKQTKVLIWLDSLRFPNIPSLLSTFYCLALVYTSPGWWVIEACCLCWGLLLDGNPICSQGQVQHKLCYTGIPNAFLLRDTFPGFCWAGGLGILQHTLSKWAMQHTTLWWLRHGRGGVCALIRSPLIGSVSHQQAVGQCRGELCRVWCCQDRTGGNLPVCRQERREEPDSLNSNLLHLQPHLHLGKTPVKKVHISENTQHKNLCNTHWQQS